MSLLAYRTYEPGLVISDLDFFECVCCAVNDGHLFALCYFVLFVCSVSWLFLLGCQYQYYYYYRVLRAVC